MLKKNVIIIDLYPQQGHFHFNNEIISAFTKFTNVSLYSPSMEYLTYENKKNVSRIIENKIELIYEKKTRLKYLELFFSYYLVAKHIKKNDYSFIYVLTFHNTHLLLFLINLSKKILNKTFFNLHNNLSNILNSESSREKLIFSLYQNKINAVCNSSMILDTALDHGFNFNSLRLVRLPLIFHNLQKANEYVYDSVFISLSNNKSLLNELIAKENKKHVLSKNLLRVFLNLNCNIKSDSIRSKETKWLNEDSKNSLLASTWSVGVFFDRSSYTLRCSASIIEALSNNKIVFATKTDISEYLSKLYPDIVILVDSIDDFINKLILNKNKVLSTKAISQFIKFRETNSHENLTNDCKLLLEHINT